jgi:hypothetical protein
MRYIISFLANRTQQIQITHNVGKNVKDFAVKYGVLQFLYHAPYFSSYVSEFPKLKRSKKIVYAKGYKHGINPEEVKVAISANSTYN